MTDASQILVLETTTTHASVGIRTRAGDWHEAAWSSQRDHHHFLFGHLQTLIRHAGVASNQFDLVLVGSGPGSYSGTRVGIAAAQGVSLASNCTTAALPSLAAVASAKLRSEILVIGDARRSGFWHASVRDGIPMREPLLSTKQELAAQLEQTRQQGIPIVSWEEPSRFPFHEELIRSIRFESPLASGLMRTWQQADPELRLRWQSAVAEPLYLMPPLITPSRKHWTIRSTSPEAGTV